jgi:signal peptidase II
LFLLIVGCGLTADLLTKAWVFDNHFNPHDSEVSYWWIDGVLGIQTSFNGGALFGMFQGGSWWLAGLSLVALSGVLAWLFVFRMASSRFLTVVLAMICAGILGNLYDRMGYGFAADHPPETACHVRDWIHFRLQGIPFFDPWPNFNIADSLLVTGAFSLFLFALLTPDPPETEAGNAGSRSPDSLR